MPTEYKRLKDRSFIRNLIKAAYLDGECYAFAIAMHQNLGWAIHGLIVKGEIRHVFVCDHQGVIYDARGKIERADLGKPFGVTEPYDIRVVTVEELQGVHPVSDHAIELVARMAQALWPELPWKETAYISRIKAYFDAIEAVSREHGFWIYGVDKHPFIADGVGDEYGYAMQPTVDGQTCSFCRKISA